MKDKVKGLIVGLTIGSVLSGTVAFAAGTQIEVAFRNLTYMFDGVEKTPTAGKGFIYEGDTYVPLRFMSDSLGKKVTWDDATSTIWVGNNPNQVVATYTGGTVTKAEFDVVFNLKSLLDSAYASSKDNVDYQTSILKELVTNRILYGRASVADQEAAKKSAAGQVAAWKQQMGADKFQTDLKNAKVTETELQYFLVGSMTATNYLKSSVTDAQLKSQYDAALTANKDAFTIASVRHILIEITDQAGKALRTKEEALTLAKDIQQKLKNGGDFAALAKQYSEDPGSKDNGGLYADADVSQWVEGFKNAAISQAVGTIGEPVETEFGYHVIKVDSRSVKPFAAVKESLRPSVEQAQYQQFVEKELPTLIEKIDLGQ
ncbi:peptidylprolyl isomerase [Paenibacillus qinlingensis]|uniref:peptidylprolyl isomerase n=1 Tax=Paenibacillus qinlingensis TaxID=1837343 RepID=UPI0015650324|nr:peptidylprolyl isomerase [Paenibacillus qinlingensis]NQX59120.1 peptidylprolyl isomerase [Paenibacillus qinlingensis]